MKTNVIHLENLVDFRNRNLQANFQSLTIGGMLQSTDDDVSVFNDTSKTNDSSQALDTSQSNDTSAQYDTSDNHD